MAYLDAGTRLVWYKTSTNTNYKYRIFYRFDDDFIAHEMRMHVDVVILGSLKHDTKFVTTYVIPDLATITQPTCVMAPTINTYMYIIPWNRVDYISCMGKICLTGKTLRHELMNGTHNSSVIGTAIIFCISVMVLIIGVDLFVR